VAEVSGSGRLTTHGVAEFGLGETTGDQVAGPTCLVLGNFDGVHIGHQAILAAAALEAGRTRAELTAITFEPHPRTVIEPGRSLPLLSPFELKRRLLVESGVDRLWVIPFDERVRRMSPDTFMDRLRDRLRIETMVVGPTFSIGKGAEGRLDFLREYASRGGFSVGLVDALLWEGEAVSSSAIRSRLAEGALGAVGAMLGRPFQVLGVVVHGDGMGRQLGFPTANLELPSLQALPPDGVYVMELELATGERLQAVGSLGTRPHFGGQERRFEVHCLEDPGDLYGEMVRVSVLRLLRPQEKFASDHALVERMTRDVELAAAHFAQPLT